MAAVTLERLAEGIRRANAAGDVETVKKLGLAYRQMQGGGVQPLSGVVTPKGSTGEVSRNVEGLNPESSYNFALDRVQREYFPGSDREKLAAQYAPYDAGKLLNAGLTFGFNDEAAGAGQAVGAMTQGKDIGRAYSDFTNLERAREEYGAEKAGPLGVVAEMGGAVLAGRPDMAAARAVGLIPNVVQGAKAGAFGGGIYGAGASEGGLVERAHGAAESALTGAGVGAAIPAVVAGARRVISPMNIPAAKQHAATILEREGVDLTAGQQASSQNLQFREAELGGRAAQAFGERQARQFTAATLRRIGVAADESTPDVLEYAGNAIGQQFDDLAARNVIVPDRTMAQDLQQAWQRFEGSTNPSTRPRVIERIVRDIYDRSGGPAIVRGTNHVSGEWYKATRSELGRLSKSQNPELAEAARDLQHALDDAMERSLRQHNPADLGGWQEARRLYKNLLVVEDAATRAGAQAADGIITPQALRSAAIRQGKRAFARGRNEFTDLANAGVSTMTPLPNSGTAGRLNAKSFLPIGAGTGATIGGVIGGIPGAAVGAVAGAAVPWAVGRAILSGPGRRYLTNQAAAGPTGGQAAVIGALIARSGQPLLPRVQ